MSSASYQDILTSAIGEMGKSQWIIAISCNLPNFLGAWSMIIISFAAASTDWWRVSEMYNATNGTTYTLREYKTCPIGANDTVVYEENIHSIIKEWGLICDKESIPVWIKTTQMSGVLVGAAVIGQLGDWVGRQKCLLVVFTLQIISIFIVAFSTNWIMMAIFVFLVGFSLGGFLVLQKVFSLEYIGTSWRSFIGFIPFWATGVLILGCVYIGLPNWRYLYIINASVGAPLIICIWFIPESVRWLFSKGRIEEGKKILKKVALRNGRPEPELSNLDSVLSKEIHEEKGQALKYNYVTLFKYKVTRWRCPLFSFLWFTCAYSYYALTFDVSLLYGNVGGNMALFGAGEMFSLVLIWLISKVGGRKLTTLGFFAMTSLSSFGITIAYATNASSFNKIRTALAITSRFFLSASWGSLIIYTVEIFPTKMRSAAYGFVSVMARVGGIVAPQTAPLYDIAEHIPYTINGCLAAICSFLILFLHDTDNEDLPDVIAEDQENNPLVTSSIKTHLLNRDDQL